MRQNIGIAGAAPLLFLGALLWAWGRDPFQRDWFSLPVAGQGRVWCVAVLPKTAPRPYPVVVYLHGSGGNVLGDGNDLRQVAELGLAVVGMDYCQTNDAVCETQFTALLRYLDRQPWVDTNAMAWAGFSLGAEKVTRFWLGHREARPRLLVRLAGGWMSELEKSEIGSARFEGKTVGTLHPGPRTLTIQQPWQIGGQPPAASQDSTASEARPSTLNAQPSSVLLVHGEQDAVFPVADAAHLAEAFRAKGAAVELQVLPGQSHGFSPGRGAVFRAVGEYCLTRLRGEGALVMYRSIGMWQAAAWPLWVYWLPVLAWGVAWLIARRNAENSDTRQSSVAAARESAEGRGSGALRGLAAGLAALAVGLTAVHVVTPRLPVSDGGLSVARRVLVQQEEREDFEHLAGLFCWGGHRLGALLEHAHLARYNRSLVNWTLEDATYREFVLSPVIEVGALQNLRWRRVLWESLYPRVRKDPSAEAAAETVVRHLRERVTMAAGGNGDAEIEELWRSQKAVASGFERLTVAGLRSVGIAARLDGEGRAEMWVEGKWRPAPRAVVGGGAVR
jgi:acetyl esterase/lipase